MNKKIKTNKKETTPKKIKQPKTQKPKEKHSKEKKKNNKKLIFALILLLILSLIGIFVFLHYQKLQNEEAAKIAKKEDILSHYNKLVITNKEANIYTYKDNKYELAGKINKDEELTLDEITITENNEYLKIMTFEKEYYIYYKDIEKIDVLSEESNRYQNYIVFNENIITKKPTNFYDESGILIYSFNSSFDLPIIIKKNNSYGVEYNNKLLYINKEDVIETKYNQNTNKSNTSSIAVFNYHFFYDETLASERNDCNQIICHPKSLFESHLKYIKDNNIFTPTMKEFEMYLDKQINLPKSVLLTIDDGWRTLIAEKLLEEYKLNATIFLITSWFDKIDFLYQYDYVEYHSHGDNLHNGGVCPGGLGGGIKCLGKETLLKDLKLSREKLDGSTYFCYPFYEYNSYSINVLKEAGFTMSFRGGFQKATPGVNKFEIPRYVIYNNTSVSQIASYIN